MRLDRTKIIARREYIERVRSKGFWIGTVLFPLFFVAMAILPPLFLARTSSTQEVVVVDTTGRVASGLREERQPSRQRVDPLREDDATGPTSRIQFLVEEPRPDRAAQDADLNRRVLAKEIDAWIRVDPGVFAGEPLEYHGRSTSNFMTQRVLERRLSEAVRRVRLADAGFDPDKVGDLSAPVELRTIKVSETGSRAEGGEAGFLLAYILFFMLFLGILIWGQQVMNGVLEEKGTRVVEVLISSIKPFELMMGKLLGICLVALTQFAVWVASLVVVTTPGLVGSLTAMPAGLDIPTFSALTAIHFLLFFALGFIIYASFYAALGAAFNNLQEAQQVAGTMGVIFAVPAVLMPITINDPSSTIALVSSLIPLFTPVLMPLRIVVETPPAWQILLGYALSIGFLLLMVWLCGRIYRVGILMYGKKPTIPELVRWMRYS